MNGCLRSKISFDTWSLERIVDDPLWVLGNEESFWGEKAQRYTLDWVKQVNYEFSFEDWRQRMREWAEAPLEERRDHAYIRIANRITEGKEVFLERALPHLCSYLPEGVDLSIGVYFTAFIPPRAFSMGEIVFNVAATYWCGNADNILNSLVHEIFHVGYSHCRDDRTEETPHKGVLYDMLDNLQSEGVCTYVAYEVLPIFPAPDEKDYELLEDASEVRRLLGDLNSVLTKAGRLPDEEAQKLAWEKCVIGRAYYVVGAHMCRTIEEHMGRDALIETLTTGPAYFVELYNSLVGDEMKVRPQS
jgi:hypothetical protein